MTNRNRAAVYKAKVKVDANPNASFEMLYKIAGRTTKQYHDNIEIIKAIVFEDQSLKQKKDSRLNNPLTA